MLATSQHLPQAFEMPDLAGPLSTAWDIHITGSSLLESTQPSSVVPYTDWPGQLPAADPGPVDAGSMDGLQQVEDECVFAAKLGLQGILAGVQGLIALQRALRSHGLSAYASILKPLVQAGQQRRALDAFVQLLQGSSDQMLQAFCAKLQVLLHSQSRAVLQLDDAVAQRRSADAGQSAHCRWPGQLDSEASTSTTLLELATHTQALRRELAMLARVCRDLAPPGGTLSGLPLLSSLHVELLAAGPDSQPLLQGLLSALMHPVAAYMRAWALGDLQGLLLHEHGLVRDMPGMGAACLQDESAPAALPPLLQPVQQLWLLAGLHMRLLLQHGGPDCHVFLEAAGHLLQPACSSSSRTASAEGWDGITFEPTELAQVASRSNAAADVLNQELAALQSRLQQAARAVPEVPPSRASAFAAADSASRAQQAEAVQSAKEGRRREQLQHLSALKQAAAEQQAAQARQDAESLASAAAAQAEEQRVVQQARAGALAAAEQAAQQGQQRIDRLAWRTARLELGPARAAKLAAVAAQEEAELAAGTTQPDTPGPKGPPSNHKPAAHMPPVSSPLQPDPIARPDSTSQAPHQGLTQADSSALSSAVSEMLGSSSPHLAASNASQSRHHASPSSQHRLGSPSHHGVDDVSAKDQHQASTSPPAAASEQAGNAPAAASGQSPAAQSLRGDHIDEVTASPRAATLPEAAGCSHAGGDEAEQGADQAVQIHGPVPVETAVNTCLAHGLVVLQHAASQLCMSMMRHRWQLAEALQAFRSFALLLAGDWAAALARCVAARVGKVRWEEPLSHGWAQGALDAALQECGTQSPFPVTLTSSALEPAGLQASPHCTAAVLAAVQGLELGVQLPHVLTTVIPEAHQQQYSSVFRSLLGIRVVEGALNELHASCRPLLSYAGRSAPSQARTRAVAVGHARHVAAHTLQALRGHMQTRLAGTCWQRLQHEMQVVATDVQQLQDAHGTYVNACQAACWLQGPISVSSAVHDVIRATAAFVDSLASEGGLHPETLPMVLCKEGSWSRITAAMAKLHACQGSLVSVTNSTATDDDTSQLDVRIDMNSFHARSVSRGLQS